MALKLEDIPCMNLGKFLLGRMKQHDGNRTALSELLKRDKMKDYLRDIISYCCKVDGTTEQSYTYSEIIKRTELAAAGFQKFGVSKDDVICIVTPNHTDYLIAFYATALISATFQPINPLLTAEDIKKVLRQCNTKFLLTIPELLPKVKETLTDNKSVQVIVLGESEAADRFVTFQSLIETSDGNYTTPAGDPKKDVVALMSSSGTTGFPKAVEISHYALVANLTLEDNIGMIDPDETCVCFLPLFHMYGLYVLSTYLHVIGARLVLMKKYTSDDYLRLIEKYRPESLHVVPPIMVMFAKYPKVSEYDLSSLKSIICGAAPLSKEIEESVKAKLNVCVLQGYGMTEIGVTHFNSKDDFRFKSVGKLLPLVDMKVVDVDTGKPCGVNEEGEIWIKGPQICLGYLNAPQENKNFFTEDGWAKTGDIGSVDEDGFLYIVDRLKELIKYKGFQVAPATLEDILLTHDAVADAGVVGLPEEEAGELPRAYVVKKPGKDISEDDLTDYVNGKVAPYMKLRGGLEFVSEIPRTLSGKILRKALREKARAFAGQKSSSG